MKKKNQELKERLCSLLSVNSSLGFILFLGKCQGAAYWLLLNPVTKVPNINKLREGTDLILIYGFSSEMRIIYHSIFPDFLHTFQDTRVDSKINHHWSFYEFHVQM